MKYLIYLDACCLNRPFDDRTQERVYREAEAVIIILGYCRREQWYLLSSEAIDLEISQTPDESRKRQIMQWISLKIENVSVTKLVQVRTTELINFGFKGFDALHIACAETGKANIFLTTDDRLLRLAVRHSTMLEVKVENPFHWLRTVTNARS